MHARSESRLSPGAKPWSLPDPPGEVPSQDTPITTGMFVGWWRAGQPPGLKAVQPGRFEVIDEPVADEQRVGWRDAAHVQLRAQVPEGVRVRFAEPRRK